MRAIRRKMESRTGASITFALLLFLVCAILSSVIIVAATTASGRMSRLAETDRRYYAVTSAAELMKDLMKSKSVAVVTLTTSYSTVTYTDGIPGTAVADMNGETSASPTTEEYLIADFSKKQAGDINIDQDLLASRLAESAKTDSVQNTAGYAFLKETALSDRKLKLTSDLKRGNPQVDPLAVSIEADFDKYGNITFTVSNNGDNPFSQQLVLHANVSTSTYTAQEELAPTNHTEWTETEGDPPVEIPHSSEMIPTKTTTIELTTLSWEAD